MTIEEYFGDWAQVLDIQEADRILRKLTASKISFCPSILNVFKAFRVCSFKDLKVVILGQDPYSNLRNHKPVATGIAFANSQDTPETEYSPSLKVLIESVMDYDIPSESINFDQTLEEWEKQGVLLLNSALSCAVGNPESHILLWMPLIRDFLTNLSKQKKGLVYVIMGATAKSLSSAINKEGNHIIYTNHPSYYARTNSKMPSNVWKEINEILVKQYGYSPIQWYKQITI